jgi:hypothetical protein
MEAGVSTVSEKGQVTMPIRFDYLMLCCMSLFPCKLAYSALLGLDSTFPKLDKNVAKKISHATQHYLKHWRLLAKYPVYGCGMLLMKTIECVAVGISILLNRGEGRPVSSEFPRRKGALLATLVR